MIEHIDGQTLVDRAEQMTARLLERGAAAETAGRLSEQTISEVVDAGLMRATVPRRFGGLEVDYRHVPAIQRALGHGCLATAWTIGINIQHNFQLGFYPFEAQQEVWDRGPDTFAPGYIVPGGTALPVPGGYRLKGHWRYGSGFPHGHWILLSAFEIVNGEQGPLRRFILPVADCQAKNNWHISGLAATGTWDCLLDDVFVPSHRSMLASGMMDGTAPGIAANPGPLWRIALIPFYYPNMAAMMLGAAEGVHRLVCEQTRKRVFSYGGAHAADLAYVRSNLGRHTVTLEAAAAMLQTQIARVESASQHSGLGSAQDRFPIRPACTWAVKQARSVVNELCDQAGTSSFLLSSPLQRFQREINVLSSHAFYEFDRQLTAYGQLLLEGTLPEAEMA